MADATVTVRRANVILDIPNDEAVITKYINNGYDVINSSGEVIRESTHGKGETELRIRLETLQTKYDKLLKENKDLKAKLDALIISEADMEEVIEKEVVPRKKRSVKKS